MSLSLSLYIHIPFCRAKCHYCDFNSYPGQERLIPRYLEAVTGEAREWSCLLERPSVKTIYFGGGTPTLLDPEQVGRLMDVCAGSFSLADDAEITVEANPETVSKELLHGLRRLGVNRISLGVQSFDGGLLKVLGRIHDVERALTAYRWARESGFPSINLDFIYGIPGQSLESWRRSLETALELMPDHLSLYCLTLEEGTPLQRKVLQWELEPPDPDLAADMYLLAEERLGQSGYLHYELSNWARPGHEGRHNLTYWQNQPYLGLGAGAHSYLSPRRFGNAASIEEYIDKVSPPWTVDKPGAAAEIEVLSPILEQADTVILGLRLGTGLDAGAFARRFGVAVAALYGPQIEELTGLGLLTLEKGCLQLTQRGRLLGNEVFLRFLAHTNTLFTPAR